MNPIAFIGAGNMAKALIYGLIDSGVPAEQLRATDIASEQLDPLEARGVITSTRAEDILPGAAAVVLAVKPQVLMTVLQALPLAEGQLLVSIAAGISVRSLQQASSPNQAIVRCMPNTPALVGSGMTALYSNAAVSAEQADLAETLMRAVGAVVSVPEEAQIDAVTAVSGSGPAYFFYLMEAMIRAGVALGLDEATATQLTEQTALGAARLAASANDGPGVLRANVTSPGGTTERALNILNEHDVADAIVRALQGAARRSEELAGEFGS